MVAGILTGDVMQAVSKEMFSGADGPQMAKEELARRSSRARCYRRGQEAAGGFTAERGALECTGASNSRWAALARPDHAVHHARRGGDRAAETKYNGYAHAFAGMVVQFVLFLGIDVGIGIAAAAAARVVEAIPGGAAVARECCSEAAPLSAAILAFFVVLVNFLFARPGVRRARGRQHGGISGR